MFGLCGRSGAEVEICLVERMSLLFDQNISFRIVREILPLFPGSKQLREAGLEGKQDREIWKWAKSNGFSIATFD